MGAEHAIAGEVWKPVVGYQGIYSVSSIGRVRRESDSNGTHAGLILKPIIKGNRYARVYLWRNCKGVNAQIHRLVAEAFIAQSHDGLQVNHKNGVTTDNRVENLEWVTSSQNTLHAFDVLKSRPVGEASPLHKLTEFEVREIFNLAKSGMSGPSIARRFGIGNSQVVRIKQGRSWRHLKLADCG